MTANDVTAWIAFHDTCFPGFRAWINEQTDPRGVADMMGRVLLNVTIGHAKAASEGMLLSGKSAPFGRHIQKVRALCDGMKAEVTSDDDAMYVDGVQVYHCQYCHDSGFESVPLFGKLLERARRLGPSERTLERMRSEARQTRKNDKETDADCDARADAAFEAMAYTPAKVAAMTCIVPCRRVTNAATFGRPMQKCGGR